MKYDVIIVGAGPTGLALAQTIPESQSVLVIDAASSVGGCHRVTRTSEKYFGCHSPMIYSTRYTQFKKILVDLELSFEDIFVRDSSGVSKLVKFISEFTFTDIFKITVAFLNLESYMNTSVEEFCLQNGISKHASEIMDKVCRASDGAGANRYTMYAFLEIINSHVFHSFCVPRIPLDASLFNKWQSILKQRNTKFALNTTVIKLNRDSVITDNNIVYTGDKIIFAIPPKSFDKLHSITSVNESSYYEEYIGITYHWDNPLPGNVSNTIVTSTAYGLEFGVYFNQTVISVVLTRLDRKHRNKTANECNSEQELINKVFAQLKEILPELPDPDKAVLAPGVYKSLENKWVTKESAFIKARSVEYITPYVSDNVYWAGTHNGNSSYPFTSLESAVSNGVSLAHKLFPETSSKFAPEFEITLIHILRPILLWLVVVCATKILKFSYKRLTGS